MSAIVKGAAVALLLAGCSSAPFAVDPPGTDGGACATSGSFTATLTGDPSNGIACPATATVAVQWAHMSKGTADVQFALASGAPGVHALVSCSAFELRCNVALSCDSGYSMQWIEMPPAGPSHVTLAVNGPCKYSDR